MTPKKNVPHRTRPTKIFKKAKIDILSKTSIPAHRQGRPTFGSNTFNSPKLIKTATSASKHSPQADLDLLRHLVRSSHRIIVISGAGISVNAGFPTFQDIRTKKQTSFDFSLYSSPEEIDRFHSTVCGMFERLRLDSTRPSSFHELMKHLAVKCSYFQNFTQNIDCVETLLPELEAKTTRLHGRIDQARCQNCNWVTAFDPHLFQGGELPSCERCSRRCQNRVSNGRRSVTVGRLKPDVVLYGEFHPDDAEIFSNVEDGLRKCPQLVLIVGTKLRVPGARSIATKFCKAARNGGGASFWISEEEPVSGMKELCDYVILGDCDKIVPLSILL